MIKILCYITGVNFCPHLVSQILGYWNVEGSYKGVTVMFSDAPSQGGGLKSYPELSVGRYIFISQQGNTKNPATRFYVVLNKIETQTDLDLSQFHGSYC